MSDYNQTRASSDTSSESTTSKSEEIQGDFVPREEVEPVSLAPSPPARNRRLFVGLAITGSLVLAGTLIVILGLNSDPLDSDAYKTLLQRRKELDIRNDELKETIDDLNEKSKNERSLFTSNSNDLEEEISQRKVELGELDDEFQRWSESVANGEKVLSDLRSAVGA